MKPANVFIKTALGGQHFILLDGKILVSHFLSPALLILSSGEYKDVF